MLVLSFWSLTAKFSLTFIVALYISQKKDELVPVSSFLFAPNVVKIHTSSNAAFRLSSSFFAASEVWKQKCVVYWFEFAENYLIWDCSPTWLKIKKIVHMVMMDPFADLFITVCIVINTIFMAMEYHRMDTSYIYMLTTANVVRMNMKYTHVQYWQKDLFCYSRKSYCY